MNPRVSRSSALASKATGYPIAKVAAKLAVGYTLDEIPNDLTKTTPASFEPTLDYVVVKIPRFAFEKFPGADTRLGTQMKSVGETMGIGRTFREAFVKAERGLEAPLDWQPGEPASVVRARARARRPRAREAADAHARVPPHRLVRRRGRRASRPTTTRPGARPTRRRRTATAPRVVILGSGPNRIGQGIEFDYCCVHAAQAFRALGYEAVMVNSQPRDGLDRLRHERPPLLRAARCRGGARRLQARAAEGVVIQFGGQTPLKLASRARGRGHRDPRHAVRRGRPRRGPRALRPPHRRARHPRAAVGDGGERRPRRKRLRSGSATRCSCGRRTSSAAARCASATRRSEVRDAMRSIEGRVLVDRFLEDAIELDVDALADGTLCYVAAVMQHVEEAGVHSGDSSCVLPAPSLDPATYFEVCHVVRRLARGLGVVGLLNVQLALSGGVLYVLEANPRASRTVPFASKATGVNLVEAACKLATGVRISRARAAAGAAARAGERQGGRAAVRALPRRRPGARPGDALDRRGDGERARLPDRVREGGARGGTSAAVARHRVPLGARRRQAGAHPDRRGARRPRLRARSRQAAPPTRCAPPGSTCTRSRRAGRSST